MGWLWSRWKWTRRCRWRASSLHRAFGLLLFRLIEVTKKVSVETSGMKISAHNILWIHISFMERFPKVFVKNILLRSIPHKIKCKHFTCTKLNVSHQEIYSAFSVSTRNECTRLRKCINPKCNNELGTYVQENYYSLIYK